MELSEILTPDLIDLDVEIATKKEIILSLSKKLYKVGHIRSVSDFVDSVYERERVGPTGMGMGIAIPHGLDSSVLLPSVAIIRLKEPIKWESGDEEDVKLVFLLGIPKQNEDNQHIKILSRLAATLAHESVIEELLKARTKEEFIEVLSRKEVIV